jgi:hypothetical protein
MVSLDLRGGTVAEVGCHPVSEAASADADLYFFAHSLLPADFVCGEPAPPALVAAAIATLNQPETATSHDVLRALVLLGHSPSSAALEALSRAVAQGGPWAGVAELARAECADWGAALGAPLVPLH